MNDAPTDDARCHKLDAVTYRPYPITLPARMSDLFSATQAPDTSSEGLVDKLVSTEGDAPLRPDELPYPAAQPTAEELAEIGVPSIKPAPTIYPSPEEEEKNLRLYRNPVEAEKWAPLLPHAFRDGFFQGVPEKVYHAHPALSRSMLTDFVECNARLEYALRTRSAWEPEEDESTPAQKFGTALHSLVLEPHEARETYQVAPPTCQATKGSGKPCTYAPTGYYPEKPETPFLCGTHSRGITPDPNVEVVAGDDADRLRGMMLSLASHDEARRLLVEEAGVSELTAIGNFYGLPVRARYDRLIWQDATPTEEAIKKGTDHVLHPRPVIVDLKTTKSAHPDDVRRDMGSKGYWLQAGLYPKIYERLTGVMPRMVFVFVEKTPPFPVVVYELDSIHTEMVHKRADEILHEVSEAIEFSDFKPYTTDDIYTVGLKKWDLKRLGMEP
jgi:hypothetical protein